MATQKSPLARESQPLIQESTNKSYTLI